MLPPQCLTISAVVYDGKVNLYFSKYTSSYWRQIAQSLAVSQIRGCILQRPEGCIITHLKDMHISAGISFDPAMNCLPQSQLFEDMHIFCSSSTSSFSQQTLLVLFISFCFSSISECLIKHWQFSLFLLPSQLHYFLHLLTRTLPFLPLSPQSTSEDVLF